MISTNYRNIAEAVEYYEKKGYSHVEAPWYVTENAMDLTKPPGASNDYYLEKNNKYLVASGEQSFIYMMFKGILAAGYHQCVTPCFRFEKINDISRKCFMKNELIYVSYDMGEDLYNHLDKMVNDAKEFFSSSQFNFNNLTTMEVAQETSIHNIDIVCGDGYKSYELGSYGIRKHKNLFQWVYGTGCAEPRTSTLNKL